jgi:hypothetical protein
MQTVRYTTLMQDHLKLMLSIAAEIGREDATKTWGQLNKEVEILINHLHTIKHLNSRLCEASPPLLFMDLNTLCSN